MVATTLSPSAVPVHLTILVVNTVLIVAVVAAVAPAEAIESAIVETVSEVMLAVSSGVAITVEMRAVSATAVTL